MTEDPASNGRAALIEIGTSHVECLYSQVLFLRAGGYTVHVICSRRLVERVHALDPGIPVHAFDIEGWGLAPKLRLWRNLLEIRRLLIGAGFRIAVFNTASGIDVRDLSLLPFPKRILFAGILHDTHKLNNSKSQAAINRRIKRYFVLSDHLLAHVNPPAGVRLESVYPIFSPRVDSPEPMKSPGEFWVAVPGSVEFHRRDYGALFSALERTPLDPRVRILFLGQCDTREDTRGRMRQEIARLHAVERIMLFEEYLDDRTFHAWFRRCDLVLPLSFTGRTNEMTAPENMASGSSNLAFGYRKPLLCHEYFRRNEDFVENGFFYNETGMIDAINRLARQPDLLREKSKTMYRNPKWDFDYQKQKYLGLIGGE